jgi:hypothetical protein
MEASRVRLKQYLIFLERGQIELLDCLREAKARILKVRILL